MDLADSGSLDDSASTIDLNKRPSNNSGPKPKLEILDDFKIESELGHGGMGEVYLATERGLNRQVALKVLPAANRISSRQVQRFLLEAKAAAQLSHDHIVPIYHVGECGGVHYFTMRYIEGYDLSQIIRSGQRAMRELTEGSIDTQSPSDYKPKSKSGKSGESTAKDRADSTHGLIDFSTSSFVGSLRSTGSRSAHKLAVSVALIGQAVADALQHAHEHGIVHRDIKPSNLMLDNSNKVWVTDFGLAQLQDAPGLTSTGEILGTLRYMSPEQASARPAFIDHRTDIYSLGVTLYELATLQKACRGESAQEILRSITFERPQPIRKINPKLPRDLETIIFKATERNPSDRYQSAAEMAADLRRFANSESLMARRPSRLKGIRNWIWDRPAVSAMALAMLLVFAVSFFAVAVANQGKLTLEQLRAEEAEKALSVSQGRQLLGQSLMLKDANPGLAVAAVIEGAGVAPGPAADRAIMIAVDRNHELRTIPVPFDYPGKIACSEDGRLALVCGNASEYAKIKNRAVVVDLQLGKIVDKLADDVPITDALFFGSDRFLLTNSASSDGTGRAIPIEEIKFGKLKVWNSKSLQVIREFDTGSMLKIMPENYSRVNEQLVLANTENSATVYNVADFSVSMVLPAKHAKPVTTCLFSPDGTRIATYSLDESVVVWDTKTGQALRTIKVSSARPATAKLCFTADSRQLILSNDSHTRFVNLAEPDAVDFIRDEYLLHASAKHNVVYLGDRDLKSIKVFNADSHSVRCICKADYAIGRSCIFTDDQNVAVVQGEEVLVFNAFTGAKTTVLLGHQDRIAGLASIPGKQELVSLSRDGTIRYWHIKADLQRRTLAMAMDTKRPALVLPEPNGKHVVIGSVSITESSFRSAGNAGQVKERLKANALFVTTGGGVVSAASDSATLWDAATQRKLFSVPLDPMKLSAIDQVIEIADSKRLAMLSSEGDLYFWDLATNRLSGYAIDGEKVMAMTLDHSGKTLFVGSSGGDIYSLDLATYARKLLTKLDVLPLDMDVHSDRSLLLITGNNETAYVLDLNSQEIVQKLSQPKTALRVAKFVAGDRIMTHGGTATKSVSMWNALNGELLVDYATAEVLDVVPNQDRSKLAIATYTGVVLWDLLKDEKVDVQPLPCRTLAFVGDKLVMATEPLSSTSVPKQIVANEHQLLVWDSQLKASSFAQPIRQHISRILPVDDSEDFVLVGYEYGAESFDLETAKSVRAFSGHSEPLVGMTFGPDTNSMLTVSRDGVVLDHSLTTGQYSQLGRHDFPVVSVAFSADRRFMLTADTSPKIVLWDLRAKKIAREFKIDGKEIPRTLIDAAGTCVVFQVERKVVRHVDLRTNTESEFSFEQGVRDLALSPDGQVLLVAAGNRDVYPASLVYAEESINNGTPPELQIIRLGSELRQTVALDGLPVRCLYVDAGAKFAVLTTKGVVQVFDSKSGQQLQSIKGRRRFMQLLADSHDPAKICTVSKNLMEVWNAIDGHLDTELTLDISEAEAALRFPILLGGPSNTQFRLMLNNRDICIYPMNCLEYARKIAPRKLDDRERVFLLNSFEAN